MQDVHPLAKYLMQAGPFIWLQFLLVWVIVIHVLADTILLAVWRGKRAARLRTPIDAVLFWGFLTAIFGLLGQWSGIHRVSKVVIDHGSVNPPMVILGLGESLHTTVFGMFTLVIAGFIWFVLRAVQGWKMTLRKA